MNVHTRCLLLADKIGEIFIDGLNLSKEVVHYIDSTFSHPSKNQFEEVLTDESDCERDSLLELIFFLMNPLGYDLKNCWKKKIFKKRTRKRLPPSFFHASGSNDPFPG